MKFFLWVQFLALLAVASAFELFKKADTTTDTTAETTTSTSTSATSVYVTITTNGATAVVQSIWVQTFMSTYTTVTSSASEGSVGMGSLSGSVGGVRTYLETTISNGGQGNAVYSGGVGAAFLLLGWLI